MTMSVLLSSDINDGNGIRAGVFHNRGRRENVDVERKVGQYAHG